MIFTLLCTSAFLLIISSLLANRISKPILAVVSAARSIGKGDLNTKVPVNSNDEIGLLSTAFNEMVDNLKKSNSELRASEEQNRNVLSTALDGFWVVDVEGRILEANNAYCNLIGYSREELLKMSISDVEDLESPEDTKAHIQHIIEKGGDRFESKHRCKDGRIIEIDVSVNYVSEGGERFFVFIRDITERRKTERRLNAQHEITKVLADSNTLKEASPKIIQAVCMALEWDLGEIWMFDQQTGVLRNTEIWHISSLKVEKFKDATKHITFPAKVGLPGRVFETAKPLWIEDVVYDTNFLRAFIADKEGLHGAFGCPIIIGSEVLGAFCYFSRVIRKPDKKLLDMMMAVGRQIGLFVKRKQAEETLLQSEKLKAMGMITAGIAHDFNNILAVISGTTQILEMDNEDNKELMYLLSNIIKASDDGAEIVRKMSMFTRQKKGTSALQPVDIKVVLEQAIDFVKPRWMNIAKASGINYIIDNDGVMNVPLIMGNETELREMFINMINNSMDAMKEGGCLSFCTWQKEKDLFLSISDTGEGMPEEVKRRVFEPFYTTKREKGSGLGMSMSYGIIERHAGNIEVASEVGKGTTFTLRFPIAMLPAQQTESPVEDQKIKAKCLSVLVVDDKEEIRSLLEKFFVGDSHTVKSVESGNRAVEVLKTEHLILCYVISLCLVCQGMKW